MPVLIEERGHADVFAPQQLCDILLFVRIGAYIQDQQVLPMLELVGHLLDDREGSQRVLAAAQRPEEEEQPLALEISRLEGSGGEVAALNGRQGFAQQMRAVSAGRRLLVRTI